MAARLIGRKGLIAPAKAASGPASYADGRWRSTCISDAGTPLGTGFHVGDKVYCRRCAPGEFIILKAGLRRYVTQAQLEDFTEQPYELVADPSLPSRLYGALEPKPASELHPGVPSAYKGMPVTVSDTTPAVKEPGWEADWDGERIYLERKTVNAMDKAGMLAKWLKEALAHEWYEMECAERMAGERWPDAPVSERKRLMREVEGLAHAETIRVVDHFTGPRAEQAYYQNDKRIMDKAGLGKLVDNWPGYTTM